MPVSGGRVAGQIPADTEQAAARDCTQARLIPAGRWRLGTRLRVSVPTQPLRPRMTHPLILKALQSAQAALSRYIQPGGSGEADTINTLLRILDNEPLVRAQQAACPQPMTSAPREH